MLAGALAGLVGGGLVAGAWPLSGSGDEDSAATDAAAGCAVLDQFEPADTLHDGPAGMVVLYR